MSRFYCPVIKTLIERNKISCRGNRGRELLRDHWMATDNGLINAAITAAISNVGIESCNSLFHFALPLFYNVNNNFITAKCL